MPDSGDLMGNLAGSHATELSHVGPWGWWSPRGWKDEWSWYSGSLTGSVHGRGCSYQVPVPTSDSCALKVNSTYGGPDAIKGPRGAAIVCV